MSSELTKVVGDNPLQGREVGGKMYLQPKKMPTHVVCIACGMNVAVGMIDVHHVAHQAHRDDTLEQAMRDVLPRLIEQGDEIIGSIRGQIGSGTAKEGA